MKRLGVNIDHVATLRNARGELHPDPVYAAKLVKKAGAKLLGYACIIDRSNKKTLKIKKKIISQVKINIPTYKKNNIPLHLKSIPISRPGSRFIK